MALKSISKKTVIRTIALGWILCFWIFYHINKKIEINIEDSDIVKSLYDKVGRHQELKNIKLHSSVYDTIIEKEGLGETLNDHSFKQRCNLYMNTLMKNDSNFIGPHLHFGFNRDDYKTEDLSDAWKVIRREEQTLHDYFTHLKIYNKCYLDSPEDERFIKEQRKLMSSKSLISFGISDLLRYTCRQLEERLYPWLSFEMPAYMKWDGSASRFPKKQNKMMDRFTRPCFLSNFKNNLKGRGIVLTISDGHLDLTIRLIKLLRALENTLPIEVIYYKDLSESSISKLIEVSRREFKSNDNVLPPQDISFIDVSSAVKPKYIDKFGNFGNKILATLFNSFEEMILMDADTVVLEKPEFFFGLRKYQKTGTMFYKDRLAVEYRPKSDLMFFKKMMPSLMDSLFFNIPQTTGYTLDRKFFQGLNHYMESGLVVINRQRHFSQALIMSQLIFHLPVQARVYGDKELFWLAFVVSGNENYSFNDHFLAAIGYVTPDIERLPSKYDAREICSNHPAHINDENSHSLLWFNSGFQHCGQNDKVDFQREFEAGKRYTHLKTITEFESFFKNRLVIRDAVIPPHDIIEADNLEEEPSRSWTNMRDYCAGYTWCGYSKIGGLYDREKKKYNVQDGILIHFTNSEIEKFERLGDVWIDNEFLS
ncbi:uncharacterized protein AC631_02865 [Debaryomyces fabryi]|uniref:Uncharacterized protein n=1 Tax=Debaryomyces fabryi TaxID=58627 RepID=A0A0V1PZ30_9ASCO|nr:uncharacterized protein AC631_02865 [Debaryomyces fabryi]KSA01370.1 hypothetical protein AC631_02865 [Debaryomyces fabryi]CUM55661.1 unnamed protein product [Debaryomyces fabryi]